MDARYHVNLHYAMNYATLSFISLPTLITISALLSISIREHATNSNSPVLDFRFNFILTDKLLFKVRERTRDIVPLEFL